MTEKSESIKITVMPDEVARWNPTATERWEFIKRQYRAHRDYFKNGKRKRAARTAFDQVVRAVLK